MYCFGGTFNYFYNRDILASNFLGIKTIISQQLILLVNYRCIWFTTSINLPK